MNQISTDGVSNRSVSNETTTTWTGDTITMAFMPKCNNCNHSHICKYQEEYRKLLEKLNSLYNEYPNDAFTVELNCKYQSVSSITIGNGPYTITPNPGLDPGKIMINPCYDRPITYEAKGTIKGTNEDYNVRGVDPYTTTKIDNHSNITPTNASNLRVDG